MLEHKRPWKVLKIFIQVSSNDDLGLTLSFSVARSNLLSGLFIWVEVLDFVEDFGAQVDRYSYIGEHKNNFLHLRSSSSFDL